MRFRIMTFTDPRTRQQQCLGAAIAQEQADQKLEMEWRQRVRKNEWQRKARARANG